MSIRGELLLARHGEAHCNVAGVVGGPRTCTGLSPHGQEQIHRLARRLRVEHTSGHGISAVYAGPRQRLHETGQTIADALELPLTIEPGLDGPAHGEADGKPWPDIKTAFGGAPDSNPDRPCAPGAETWNAYLQRATSFLAELLDRHADERIVIAAHGETIIAAHTLLLAITPSPERGIITSHASLTRYQRHRNRLDHHRWLLAAHNDTAHLHADTWPPPPSW